MKEKLDMQSVDGVSANIDKIAALFPNCLTETAEGKRIDFDLLKQELSAEMVEGNKERYRLEWPGKREAIVTANLPTTNTLRPVREDSVNFDTTENIYIEGDNLEVLKLLQESYLGKIKMIYIDPPYNTGKDFVYKDNFAMGSEEWLVDSGQKDEYGTRLQVNPETGGRYHSDWLSMMYPRLKLARNLLTEDGVIFISIDDNEVHNLRKICDEIFGEGNFVSEIIWKGKGGGADNKYLMESVEYILFIAKNKNNFIVGEEKKENEVFPKFDEILKRKYKTQLARKWGANSKRSDRPNLFYPILSPDNKEIYPMLSKDEEGCWRWSQTKMNEEIKKGNIEFINNKGEWIAYEKIYEPLEGEFNTKKYSNLFDEVGNTAQGSKEVKEIFEGKLFDFPKPISLISRLVLIANLNPSDIILDFFSGSATTAHAVMQLNAEDASTGSAQVGKRKYIMVQLPEATDPKSEAYKAGYKNICEIGKERIRRAAASITNEEITNYESKKAQLEKLINAKLRITKSITNDQLGITKEELSFPEGVIIDEKAEEMLQEIRNLQFVIHNSERGFRVYRLDSSNMQEVYYRPQDYKQGNLDLFADNVKPDRSAEDLVTQIMLDWGLELSLPIEQKIIAGKEVFAVAGNSLYCCFDKEIDEAFAKAVAKDQPLRIVFRDNGFTNDTAKENVKQLLKQLSSGTEMKVI